MGGNIKNLVAAQKMMGGTLTRMPSGGGKLPIGAIIGASGLPHPTQASSASTSTAVKNLQNGGSLGSYVPMEGDPSQYGMKGAHIFFKGLNMAHGGRVRGILDELGRR